MHRKAIARKAAFLATTVGDCGLALSPASAQTVCDSIGPDIIIGDLTGTANYTSLNGIEAFSWGGSFCNIGDQGVIYSANTNQHPVFGQTLYRLKVVDGAARFEQLGQSWLQHGFFALSNTLCCTACNTSCNVCFLNEASFVARTSWNQTTDDNIFLQTVQRISLS